MVVLLWIASRPKFPASSLAMDELVKLMSSTEKKRPLPDGVIDLTVDSGDEDCRKPAAFVTPKFPKIKHEGSLSARVTPKLEDDGLEIVDEPVTSPSPVAARMPPSSAHDGDGDEDEDIEMVGGKNIVNLPHMRQHCTHTRFDPAFFNTQLLSYTRETIDKNKDTCPQCYCYVCDKPAGECTSWFSATSGDRLSNHCCANNTNAFWRIQRERVKNPNGTKQTHPRGDDYLYHDEEEDDDEDSYDEPWHHYGRNARRYRGYMDCEDYPDDDDGDEEDYPHEKLRTVGLRTNGSYLVQNNKPVVQNRTIKCQKCGNENSYSHVQPKPRYCRKCGRVADDSSLKDRADKQKQFTVEKGHFLFGRKVFEFTLETPDPRKMESYSTYWRSVDSTSPQAQILKGQLEYEAFCLDIGPRPLISEMRWTVLYASLESPSPHTETRHRSSVIGLSDVGRQILRTLDCLTHSGVCAGVTASWNQKECKGQFSVELHFKNDAVFAASTEERTRLVGLWCGIFPLKLSDLSKRIMYPTSLTTALNATYGYGNTVYTREERAEIDRQLECMACEHLKSHEEEQAKLKLLCSSGKAAEGHICDSDTSLVGIFKRLYSERLIGYRDKGLCKDYMAFLPKILKGEEHGMKKGSFSPAQIVLGFKESFFFYAFLQSQLKRYGDDTLASLLRQIENLGHEGVDYVEGLNCELLEFQRQSLKWALERETMPGGIQRLFWGKVPDDASRIAKDLWYNPLTNRFRRGPPTLVRGGFIAEEMGLGKTVISLALILMNPAPVKPVSGTLVSDIVGGLKEPWDKEARNKSTSVGSSKRGSILSRGTLVICPVSLVGQWIQEAKSKLADPGLVYPYHGQNRTRDAKVLSRNSIVVTTYQTVASDAMFHAKSSGKDYCPPLEQVRWWRIICDEGHCLRESQTQRSTAVLSIPGDHKWLVSGTPMNTSVLDLTNQFKFLGIEHPEEILRAAHSSASRKSAHRNLPNADSLMTFVLGGIMMRHTQNMKYRGTTTTLMQLPKKTERTVKIKFSDEEMTEYQNLEKEAKDFYINFRDIQGTEITKHYLKVSSKLMPLRVACAGGRYPIYTAPQTEPEDDDMIEDETTKRKATKRLKEYSKFIFESKFQYLMKELGKIRDEDPSSKSLVFSQFDSSLQWLQEELPKRGFQYRTLKGDMSMKQRAKALHDFQSDPPTTIFLLSIRAGAVGINLTQANRVFLMEPCFNPALESQAIGRVHRLGQTREVQITRFIVEDSIESRLVTFLERKYGPKKKDQVKKEAANASEKETAIDKSDAVIVGNVAYDKAELMMDDFDLLFGVGRGMPMPDPTHSGEPMISSDDISLDEYRYI